jgi:organic hydroperoxide reductase OsmC/OhrA
MSHHKARIDWRRAGGDFSLKGYTRDHTWAFASGVTVEASAAPDYLGDPERVDPEQAFVAALSSCHMLTFLAIASKRGFVVDRYTDDAVGTLEKDADGKLAITRVELRPAIEFAGDAPDAATLEDMHHQAHEWCFIASSVKTRVEVMAPGATQTG